jgi:hypothetical protein
MEKLQIKMQGQIEFLGKKSHNILLTTPFSMNESFFCNLCIWGVIQKFQSRKAVKKWIC